MQMATGSEIRHRSSAVPLACLYAALIVYASLYPFTGWRMPGATPLAFLSLPWPRWWTGFDLVSNLLGYMPLGALIFIALARSGWRRTRALPLALALGVGLSLLLEVLQNFLPQRVASNVDLALNGFGVGAGALLALLVHGLGGEQRWQAVRDRWLIGRSAGGVALLLAWPLGLLFPLPVPLGVGQGLEPLQQGLLALLQDTPAEAWMIDVLKTSPHLTPMSPGKESAAIVLGVLAPCLVAFAISLPGWRRLLLVLGTMLVALAATTLSTALNFGPQHALAWGTKPALMALASGAVLSGFAAVLPGRAAAGLGLVVLTALVALMAQAPSDPYYALSLQAWEQGRFIRFHGAAQWVGWLWPYAALGYLLVRVGARD